MVTYRFIYSPEPFDAVEWDGTNLDEIANFVPGTTTSSSESGHLAVRFPTGRVVMMDVGWRIAKRNIHDYWVVSKAMADTWIPVDQDDE